METFNKLKKALYYDGLGFEEIRKFCLISYMMGQNPLITLRKYLTMHKIGLKVHYLETDHTVSYAELMVLIDSKARPLLIIHAIKKAVDLSMPDVTKVVAVHIFQIVGEEATRL